MTPEATFLTPDPGIEAAVRATGESLLRLMEAHPAPGILSKKGAYARIMEWSMRDPAFKAQLFRFVDVLPSLDSSAEIVRHLQEYLGDKAVELNPAMRTGLAAAAFAPALVAGPVKANVTSMAGQFVAGATPGDLVKRLRSNAASGIATTIDLLGETVVSGTEADVFLQRNLDVLETVSKAIARDGKPCFSDMGPNGPLPRINLSVKVSALTPEVHPADPGRSIKALKERLRPILRRAGEAGAFINFDMESYAFKDLTLSLFKSILGEDEFQGGPAVGIAMQAYLRDCERDLRDLIAWARGSRRPIVVRLVKGAYWDYETTLAGQRGWPVPVWSEKSESDANYEKLSLLLLENADIAAPAFASHNVRSCAHAIAQADRLGIDPRVCEFQALYGMADELKSALITSGRRVREYCPVGELLPGMAYLVRRLLENTSNEGFVRLRFAEHKDLEALVVPPVADLDAVPAGVLAPAVVGRAATKARDPRPYEPEPLVRWFAPEAPSLMSAAIDAVRAGLGAAIPGLIGDSDLHTNRTIVSVDPADPARVVAVSACCGPPEGDAAVEIAGAAFERWSRAGFTERAGVLFRAADWLRRRRLEVASLEVFEAGKCWDDADGDVAEAIDYLEYYGREGLRLAGGGAVQSPPG